MATIFAKNERGVGVTIFITSISEILAASLEAQVSALQKKVERLDVPTTLKVITQADDRTAVAVAHVDALEARLIPIWSNKVSKTNTETARLKQQKMQFCPLNCAASR